MAWTKPRFDFSQRPRPKPLGMGAMAAPNQLFDLKRAAQTGMRPEAVFS
jgi:hypothetical protein